MDAEELYEDAALKRATAKAKEVLAKLADDGADRKALDTLENELVEVWIAGMNLGADFQARLISQVIRGHFRACPGSDPERVYRQTEPGEPTDRLGAELARMAGVA